ncbi:hypothetical protein IID62_08775 [candidate division KSB1 bacterium]|nr:hypothetical protein [candidate division KSB1 bacterium]
MTVNVIHYCRHWAVAACALAVISLVICVPLVYSQDIEALFTEGNRMYQDGEYEEALIRYSQIVDSGFESGELYYNIGNAYYKIQETGFSVLFYERARRLMPEDDDLLNNIDLISLSLADRISPLPELFYVRYWNTLRKMLSMSAWKGLFFSVWILTAINIIILLFVKQKQAKDLVKLGVIAGGIVIIAVAAVFITASVGDKPGLDGVIMMPEISVFSSPSEIGTEVFLIHEGTKIRIKRTLGDWIEIRLADGKVGWIPRSSIEII